MPDYHQPLIPGEVYHLFSRAVGSEKLFICDENYRYFLSKCLQHLDPVAEFYTYSLLPNHFHFVVRIRPVEAIIKAYEKIKPKAYSPHTTNLSDFIMERFSNLLNAYTKAFNKTYNRKGSLFMDYLRRSHANSNQAFTNFIFYVHKNAVHHGFTKQIGDWPFDAYQSLLSLSPTNLLRDELLSWFGGREGFKEFHERKSP